MKKIISFFTCITMILTAFAFFPNELKVNAYDYICRGIDVSSNQGNINWNTVKSDNIQFAIIRSGLGKYSFQEDKNFKTNYSEAKNVGIKVGTYWVSYAMSVDEAYEEAEICYSVIKGYNFDYPVYYDMEVASQSNSLSKQQITNIGLAFCQRIASYGYKTGIYANRNWFTNYIDKNQVINSGYEIWLAQYPSGEYAITPEMYDKSTECGVWQYSSKGSVSGINGNVDVNVSYVDYGTAVDCGISLSGFQNPTEGYKHTPGANCGLYGTITSSHTLKHVWGGVYNLDGTKAPGSSTVCDDYPNSTSYSLRGTFNNTVIFDDIPEGYYFFSISAEDSDGYKKELIHNKFTVGNPIKNYTVNLDANGGTCSASSITVQENGTYSGLPTPSKQGYAFIGWSTKDNKYVDNGTSIAQNADHTLIAVWEKSEITVTFDANGGTVSPSSMIFKISGTYNNLPVPIKEGYVFNGWYTENGEKADNSGGLIIESDHTLYAKWVETQLSSIEITEKPSKLAYKANEKLDTTGLKLKATYNNGETKEIIEGFDVSYDFSSIGKKEVTIAYEGKSVKYEVEVTYSDLKITLIEKTENSIIVEWNEIETADNYKLEITYVTDEIEITKNYTTNTPNYILDKLEIDSKYIIKVTSYNETNMINASTITVRTLPVVPFKGEGTEENPFQIATKDDLFTLAALVNDADTTSKYGLAYYVQTADIDLENELFEPIGTRMKDGKDLSKPLFGGNYNGQGHEIKNLYVNKTDGNYAGLFGSLKGNLAIENLIVYGEVICSTNSVGGIAGEVVNGGGTIRNCAFIGNVKGNNMVGGITGVIWQNGTVENCYHIGNITGNQSSGGILGAIDYSSFENSKYCSVKNCYNIGVNVGGENRCGAIVGLISTPNKYTAECIISNCYYLKDDCETGSNGEATECEINAITPNLMKKIADDLGEPFVTNTNPDLNNGYPVFEWQLNPVIDEPDILFGDVNNDGEINLKDVVLIRRYIVGGWDVDINEAAADVNHDEAINLKDVVMIRRYIVGGWDVELNG